MKVEHGASNVLDSGNTGASSNFRIKASAHAFRILSSGLYSDKIGAVLREIGCNAADAHVAAGIKQTPFEVKLPNTLDPHFYIKDFGPGLGDEEVRELYSTYFASTKQTSNDFTGAFGLGSKSPFSYTDSFTVTSVKDGIRRIYTAHLNDEGSPAITLMSEHAAEDDWFSGVSVGFPVRAADFDDFREKAVEIYRHFTPLPRVLGVEQALVPPVFSLDTPEYGLSCQNGALDRSSVLMGNVRYPLYLNRISLASVPAYEAVEREYREKFEGSSNYVQLARLLYNLCNAGLLLKLPIGSVQVTASREDLEYDPASREALTTALIQVTRDLGKRLRAIVEDETVSLWERRLKAQAFLANKDGTPTLENKDLVALWRFCDLPESHLEFFLDAFQSCPNWLGDLEVKASLFTEAAAKYKQPIGRTIYQGKYRKGDVANLPIKRTVAIIIGDLPFATQRVRVLLSDKKYSTVLLLTTVKTGLQALEKTVGRLREYFGDMPIHRLSELQSPDAALPVPSARAKRIRADEHQVMLRTFLGDNAGSKSMVKLQEVPSDCRYVLIQPTGVRMADRYWAEEDGAWDIGHNRLSRSLVSLCNAVSENVQALQTLPVRGYVVVSPREFKQLKLREQGYQPLVPTLCTLLERPEVLSEIAAILASRPPHPLEGAAAQILVEAVKRATELGALVKTQLEGTELGELVLANAQSAYACTSQQNAVVELIRTWYDMAVSRVHALQLELHTANERLDKNSVFEQTLPAWVDFIKHSHQWHWRETFGKETLPAGWPSAVKALLTPAENSPKASPLRAFAEAA